MACASPRQQGGEDRTLTDDRLGSILNRQGAILAKRKQEDDAAAERARLAKEAADAADAAWGLAKPVLNASLNTLNDEIAGHGLKIYSWFGGQIPAADVDKLLFGLTKDRHSGTLQKLSITVNKSGTVHVVMGTANTSPAKHYSFELDQVDEQRWRDVFLDFLDVNIAK